LEEEVEEDKLLYCWLASSLKMMRQRRPNTPAQRIRDMLDGQS
jgi:hypothetical protein